MTPRSLMAAALAVSLGVGGAALVRAADDDAAEAAAAADELFKSAKEAYDAKKYGKALQDLNALVGAVGKLRLGHIKAALPPAPSGWTAEDATGDWTPAAFFGGGMTAKRSYRKAGAGGGKGEGEDDGDGGGGGGPEVEVEVVTDSPFVAMLAPMLANPMLLQGQEGTSVIKIAGRNALVEWRKGEKQGTLQMLLAGNTTLLKLSGTDVEKSVVVDTFAKGIDLAKLEKALAE